jgi:hypothetical protein
MPNWQSFELRHKFLKLCAGRNEKRLLCRKVSSLASAIDEECHFTGYDEDTARNAHVFATLLNRWFLLPEKG